MYTKYNIDIDRNFFNEILGIGEPKHGYICWKRDIDLFKITNSTYFL